MSTEHPRADRRTRSLRALLTVLFLITVISAVAIIASAENDMDVRLPISIEGDDGMDAYFIGQEGDGLSWETAYVLEGVEIPLGDDGHCLRISNTTRHLVVRNCLFKGEGATNQDWGVLLDTSENIKLIDCQVQWTGRGIGILGSMNVTVDGSTVFQMVTTGIYTTGSENVWIIDSRVNNSRTGVVIDRSHAVSIHGTHISTNGRGLIIRASSGSVVGDCTLNLNDGAGLSIEDCESFHLVRNVVEWNAIAGIQVSGSSAGVIKENKVTENYRGITLYTTKMTFLESNNVTRNDVLGIRLSSSDGNPILKNTIRSNWNVGLNLLNSHENLVRDNTIASHERGIVLSGSKDNEIVDNRILGNWMRGIEGDVEGNDVLNNDMRANGWLRALLFLIGALIVLGVVAGVYFWIKRRRTAKAEKGKVMVRHRFPAGAKSLWPMSKVMWDEDFFKAQLATAGPQREDILRRYQQNIAAAKQMQYMAVGTMAVMLGFMASLPLIGVMNMAIADITADNVNEVLFASSTGIAVYYLMSFMILLVFGLLFTSQLMKGDIFKLLSTLPMDDKGARRIVAYLLFRMYGPPLVVVLLAFPVGGFIITWSLTFLLMALLVNGLYLVFVTYILVLIADATSRRIFSANASKGATAMRFLIMAGYLMAMMFLFITLDFLTSYISGLFEEAQAEGGSGEGINAILSLVPFPFSGAYLISFTMVPGAQISTSVLSATVAGFVVMAAGVLRMRRTVNRILARVARGVEHSAGGAGQTTTVDQVTIRTRKPQPAFLRNGLLVTSRDQGAIMYIIMPLLFPIIFIVPGADRANAGIYDAVLPFLFYMGMMTFLVNMALSSSDASVGGLMGSLPFRVLDHYRAKWLTVVMIIVIPITIVTAAMLPVADEPVKMVALMTTLVPMMMVLASTYLITFSLAFGEVNGKHTFFMSKIRMKFAKYVGIIVLQYALVIIQLAAFYILTDYGIISFWTGIVGLWALNLTLFVFLEMTARRLFG